MTNAQLYTWLNKVNGMFGLPNGLLLCIAYMENGKDWNLQRGLTAQSYKGAKGLMQLTPIALQEIRRIAGYVIDPLNSIHSMYGAAAYLKWLYKQFRDWRVAIAAYNYGYGNIKKNLMANGNVLNVEQLPRETRVYLSIADWIGV